MKSRRFRIDHSEFVEIDHEKRSKRPVWLKRASNLKNLQILSLSACKTKLPYPKTPRFHVSVPVISRASAIYEFGV